MSKLTELIKGSLRFRSHLDIRELALINIGILSVAFLIAVLLSALSGCSSVTTPIPQGNIPEGSATVLKPPEVIILNIDKMALTLDNLNLSLQAKVLNPNAESINLDSIEVSAKDSVGRNCVQETIPGGPIEPASVKAFSFDVTLPNKLLVEKKLTVNLDLKTANNDAVPSASSAIDVDIPDILDQLIVNPKIVVQADITKLSWNGLTNQIEAQIEGSIVNPNQIGLDFNVVRLLIKDKKGEVIIADDLPDTLLAPGSELSLQRTIMLPVQFMNEDGLTANVETTVRIPNYSKSFKEAADIQIPQLKELISVPQITFDTDVTGVEWIQASPNPFLKMTIAALIKNDNNFDLTTGDFTINIYEPEDTLINFTVMGSNVVQGVPGSGTRTLTNWIDFQPDIVGPMPENAYITINIDVGVPGVNEKIPLKANTVLVLKPQGWPED